jgi:hypothetical protein
MEGIENEARLKKKMLQIKALPLSSGAGDRMDIRRTQEC